MRRILCIFLPNWPIQCRRELDPQQPLILHARDAKRGQIVASCNAAAWKCGVRPTMPLAEATAIARCAVRPADDDGDLAALAKLAIHCEQFSPFVGWQTVNGPLIKPGHLFLDVTGIEILFGGNLIREVENALDYDVRIAIAETVGAAWAQAVYQEPFPVVALRLSPAVVDLLAQVGVTHVEQLLRLQRASLPARFGEELILRLDQFQGNALETIVAYRPPPAFVADRLLEYPVESRDLLERIVFELMEQVASDLAARRQGAVQLSCRLECRPPLTLYVGLYRPSANLSHLWDLMRLQLEQTLPGPVGRVTLSVQLTAALQNRQQELFGGHQESRQLELLIDRLRSRLGPQAVLRPHVTSDPLPERAVQYSQFVKKSHPAPEQRPLFLFAPIALNVTSIVPDGEPISFRFASQDHHVSHAWGPERIESGWWRGPSMRRDYYQVETATGLRYWLFRRLQDGQWFMHGEFG